METVEFLVQGSEPEPYRVLFTKSPSKFAASCTCRAAENGLHCKHRIRILEGDPAGIVSGNCDAVSQVRTWARGTDVEHALDKMRVAEAAYEQAKARLSEAKAVLARCFFG